jgi:hypothetical protein
VRRSGIDDANSLSPSFSTECFVKRSDGGLRRTVNRHARQVLFCDDTGDTDNDSAARQLRKCSCAQKDVGEGVRHKELFYGVGSGCGDISKRDNTHGINDDVKAPIASVHVFDHVTRRIRHPEVCSNVVGSVDVRPRCGDNQCASLTQFFDYQATNSTCSTGDKGHFPCEIYRFSHKKRRYDTCPWPVLL